MSQVFACGGVASATCTAEREAITIIGEALNYTGSYFWCPVGCLATSFTGSAQIHPPPPPPQTLGQTATDYPTRTRLVVLFVTSQDKQRQSKDCTAFVKCTGLVGLPHMMLTVRCAIIFIPALHNTGSPYTAFHTAP